MIDIFLQRGFDPPLDDAGFEALLEGSGCLDLYRVEWHGSLLSTDGRRLVCRFSAPDAESTRQALRMAGAGDVFPWAGTVHDAPGPDAPSPDEANVAVERSFDDPVDLEDIQAIEDAGARCLETRNVRFVRTYFSRDRRHMICLYRAPDAESVREAQRMAGVPFDSVWSFRRKG